ncbi:transglycosylase domain-containing protein [Salirhabdus sp. Marseille-P4669]|uniref:transglycosylase domain-containing protein n=1 Tax=Salirhabdus sp. Marseille-P4669 TaxID=2042310 RepID=UPI000C7CB9CA|nr:PBP1A family penicillin-binding protein [Salirhabdus sp. Marseille-P4669]
MKWDKFNHKWIKHPAVKWGLIVSLSIIFISIIGYNMILLGGKMVIDDKGFVFSEATVIQSPTGEEVATLYSQNRTFVPIDQIPEHVQNAFVAIEDERFYEHAGVDFSSVLRAVYKDVIAMDKVEGASTITQQLVKNVFLTNDKTWMRKTKEVMGAIYLERNVSKDKILEYYLNEIYFGHGVYGIEKAANYFFGKSVQNLTVSEGAMLAAIPKAPSHYSPVDQPEKAQERRNVVLAKMHELNMIDAEVMSANQGKTLGVELDEQKSRPWIETYVDLVLQEAEEKYHISKEEIYRGGYKIVTGINPTAQQIAYEQFQNDTYFNGSIDGVEGAFVLIDEETGAISAAIGGRQFKRGDINRVMVERQPGSTFKPLAVFAPALEQEDYQPFSLLTDELRTYDDDYTPRNYDDQYAGEVTMYDALVLSKNAPAVWLLDKIGISYAKEFLLKMGMELPNDRNLSIALGGLFKGVTPLQMAQSYRAFLHEGKAIEAYTILEIQNRDGEVIASVDPKETEVFSPQTAWNITRMLEAVVETGTGAAGEYEKALAGKTGSTQHPYEKDGYKDTWFVGYTPEYVGAAWIGYDQSDEEHYLKTGSSAPTMLMKNILSELDRKENLKAAFEKPDNVKDLPKPIELPIIDDLQGDKDFGLFSGVSVELQWTASEDERIVYRIYEKTEDGMNFIDEVKGKGYYKDKSAKMFDEITYFVIPYNPLTDQFGEISNEVKVD